MSEILKVTDLSKKFVFKKKFFSKNNVWVHALNRVSFHIKHGETLGLVGESGCGKSTLGRCLTRLIVPEEGTVEFEGSDICSFNTLKMKDLRKKIQYIFQDPYASLNPRMSVEDILLEPLKIHNLINTKTHELIKNTLDVVGLSQDSLKRYPHEFSGGQRQRIGIARSLILKPKLIIADEPVSALDVSIQAQIINLLIKLKELYGISLLFIAHDLSVVSHISDRVAVMYLGTVVEIAGSQEFFNSPLHPYTQALLRCIPNVNSSGRRFQTPITGDLPSVQNPPTGCKFHTRCLHATDVCKTTEPVLRTIKNQHLVACHHAERFVT